MDLIFANPAGFWMLLGLPAVLAIHFLQNRSPRIPVSTLFLLDRLAEEEHRGSAFDRLRNSAALWLQLLAVLLLTLLLVRPMPLRSDSAQAVAIILDNSNSMRAFTDAVRRALDTETHRLGQHAATTEWFLQTTDPARPALYSGTDRNALLAALDRWTPDSAEHEHTAALRRAADLAGPGGLAILVTDHIPEAMPPGVALLAIGEPLENAGFGSLAIEQTADGTRHWRATLINHGDSRQQRQLALSRDGTAAAPETLQLDPVQVRILRGEIPPGTGQMTLALTPPDAFPLDDILHILPPRRRVLPAQNALTDEALHDWAARVMKAAPDILPEAAPASARLQWIQATELAPAAPAAAPAATHRIILGAAPAPATPVTGEIIAENNPLIRDLTWNGLLCSVQPGAPLDPGDQPLLWMAGHPLILLRHRTGGGTDLHLRFDIATSNARRHPAIILLLHRFIERVRRTLPGEEAGIVELNQRLELPPMPATGPCERRRGLTDDPAAPVVTLPPGAPVHAPADPGFFQIRQAGQPVFSGAAVFTETRQADFRRAASRNDLANQAPERIRVHRRDDALAPLWLALLGLALLASWGATRNRQTGVS